ncbi:MAG: hypothetical protein Q7S48_02270 [bacterium]|nr:hypothetical protein [bacterium]
MVKKSTKIKKVVRRRKSAATAKRKPAVLEASSIGIAPEHVLEIIAQHEAVVPIHPVPTLAPPGNLPGERILFRRPLVSSRTSFWLGVGFGMFVVGVLTVLTWEFVKVEIVEAVVLGLVGR